MQIGRDRARFQRRIQYIEGKISLVLKDDHRRKILEKLEMKRLQTFN